MEKQFTGSIALTKLQSVIIQKKGQSGLIRGLFIPIEINGLEEKDGAVYMPLRIFYNQQADKYGQNGFIRKNSKAQKLFQEMDSQEKENHNKANPILGSIKDWTNPAPQALVIEEDDDLPF